MLQLISIYIAKIIACCAFLVLYYWIVLRNKRFHYYNRFYLLLSVVLSLSVPLLNLNWLTFKSSNDKVIQLFNVMYRNEPITVTNSKTLLNDWPQLVIFLSIAITLFMLLALVLRVIKLYRFKKLYPVTRTKECDFINTDLSSAPFSFFRNIFWRNDISFRETTGQQILQHELTHVKQHHTFDKLFMQIVASVFWMNPFYWLIKRELYIIHEFIADEKAVENHDTSAFAQMLLRAQFGKSIFTPANSFFYSSIKRRLVMLTTSKELRFSYAKRMIALPLLACIVLLFSFRLKRENTAQFENRYNQTNLTNMQQAQFNLDNIDTTQQKKADTVIEIRVNKKTGVTDTVVYVEGKKQPKEVVIWDTVQPVIIIDAAPPKNLGYLDKKAVIRTSTNYKKNTVTLTFEDKKTKQITVEEAIKNKIKIPPPPPPPQH